MDKKQILIGGTFVAVAIFSIPLFVLKDFKMLFNIVAGLVFGLSIIYFVAYDTLQQRSNKQLKELQHKVKSGEISPAQAFEIEKNMIEQEYQIEKQRLELAKKKQEINKMKQEAKGPGIDISAIVGKSEGGKQFDMLNNMGDIMGSNKTDVVNPKAVIGDKKSKQKDNLDDLKDLF
jgi:hypothetical protein